MFEHPIFPWQEFVRSGTKARFRSKLREEERKDFERNQKKELERHVRSTYLKEIKEQVQYLGLTSQDVYDEAGNLLKRSQKFNEEPDTEFSRRLGYNPMKLYELAQMGLEYLPRSTTPPKVVKESQNMEKLRQSKRISAKAAMVLCRTNYKLPLRISHDTYDDDWIQRGHRARHAQVLISILHFSLLRGDFLTAWKVFPILVRFSDIDVRQYWTVGVELLNQKHKNYRPGAAFLDWLLVNHPSGRGSRKSFWRSLPRALELLPFLLMIKLAHGDVQEVCDQIDDLILSKPYTGDPTIWAFYGLALIQAGKLAQARAKFERCKQLGGLVPKIVQQTLSEKLGYQDPELANDSEQESNSAAESS